MKKKARKGARRERRGRGTWTRILEEEGVRRALWMLRVPTSFSEAKGLTAEEKTLQGLKGLQRRKVKFYPAGGVIKNVTFTMHFSQKDKEGIDIEVEFQDGERIFVDAKGRQWDQDLAEKLLRRNRCLIAVPMGTSDEEAEEMAYQAVSWFLQERQEREKERREDQLLGAHR